MENVDAVIERFVVVDGVAPSEAGYYYGGGGILSWGTLTLNHSTVTGSEGGILGLNRLTITSSKVLDNEPSPFEGGIHSLGELQLVDGIVSGNPHGGIHSWGSALIIGSTISGNLQLRSGAGGIFCHGPLVVMNSTISGNSTTNSGGGILAGGDLLITNSTIIDNVAGSDLWRGEGGGIAILTSGSVTIRNSLIAENDDLGVARGDYAPDCYALDEGVIPSAGHNLVGVVDGCNWAAETGDQVGSAASQIDPLLGPLQDYGGPTPTHALLAGSPAIDTGNPATPGTGGNACETTDQRGVLRPQGATCDIGAFELVQAMPATIDIKPGSDRKPINLKSKGRIPVAVLGSASFDVTTVDVTTLEFGSDAAAPVHQGHLEDVNSDGWTDLMLHFRTQESGILPGDTEACLTGEYNGGSFEGCDAVVTVPRS